MPAAAVIPAPIAYTNVVAVKKLVVGFQIEIVLALTCVSQVWSFFQKLSSTFMTVMCD